MTPSTSLRAGSLAEATTLALLIFVAVPLKHVAGLEIGVRILGPIHGVAFLVYLWTLMQTIGTGGWRRDEVLRMIVVACIPLAGFFNQRWLSRKLQASARIDALA